MYSYTGEAIRKARKAKGLTQKQLGGLCGIADSNIRKYENGNQKPKLETLQRIAKALEIPWQELLEYEVFEDGEAFNRKWDELTRKSGQDSHNETKIIHHVLTDKEQEVVKNMMELNEVGQNKVLEYSVDLTKIPDYRRGE